ncbi:hypothetical protein KSP39_PZI023896 [Platanthera zijinensis]|uniref:Uncharacterized protein n=1 Tax=Platanthera zijinensis TaxID=2320716 RepID=A0AAP0ATM1_9ASPA
MSKYSAHLLLFSIIIALHFSDAAIVGGRMLRVEKIQNDKETYSRVPASHKVKGYNDETIILEPKKYPMVQELGKFAVQQKYIEDASFSTLMVFKEVFRASFTRYKDGFIYKINGKVLILQRTSYFPKHFEAEVVVMQSYLGQYMYLKSFLIFP